MTALAATAGHLDLDQRLRDAFEEALAAARTRARTVTIGIVLADVPVCLSVTGEILAERLFRPFGHLVLAPGAAGSVPALTIEAWSQAETGIAPPPFPAGLRAHSASGNICYRNQPGDRALADRQAGRVLSGFEGAASLSYSNLAKPFRSLLIPLLHDRGRQSIHGGMVVSGPGGPGLLLVGRSGSGKSTVALSALAGGFGFLGDDHLCVGRDGDPFAAHSLYGTCGIARDHLANFSHLPGSVTRAPDRDKCVVLLSPEALPRLVRSAAIGAIVVPVIRPGGPTRVRETSRGEAMRALMPGSISPRLLTAEASRYRQFESMAALAAQFPTFRLELGPDLDAIAQALHELAAGLPGSAAG